MADSYTPVTRRHRPEGSESRLDLLILKPTPSLASDGLTHKWSDKAEALALDSNGLTYKSHVKPEGVRQTYIA